MQEVSLVPPETVAEVKREHYLFHWNSNGVSVEDARAGRRAKGRNPARQSAGIAAADAQDAVEADEQQKVITGLGEGSALKHVGSESLEAAIEHASVHKAAVMILSETRLSSKSACKPVDVSNYIASRLNWRVQRDPKLWKSAVLSEHWGHVGSDIRAGGPCG